MAQQQYRRRRPGLEEGFHPDEMDKDPADSDVRWMLEGGDTGRIGAEHRRFLQLW